MELVDLKSTQSETQKRMQPQILIADDHSMIRKGYKPDAGACKKKVYTPYS